MLFLLSLSREDAIAMDAGQPDSCARFTPDGYAPATAHEEWDPVMLIARWTDVHRARERLAQTRVDQLIVHMRVLAFTEREIAEYLGFSHATARRRFRASVDEILEQLGGAYEPAERTSTVSACLRCGVRPRARLAERRRKVRGGWKMLQPERLAGLCAECIPEDRRHRLVGYVPPVADDTSSEEAGWTG